MIRTHILTRFCPRHISVHGRHWVIICWMNEWTLSILYTDLLHFSVCAFQTPNRNYLWELSVFLYPRNLQSWPHADQCPVLYSFLSGLMFSSLAEKSTRGKKITTCFIIVLIISPVIFGRENSHILLDLLPKKELFY